MFVGGGGGWRAGERGDRGMHEQPHLPCMRWNLFTSTELPRKQKFIRIFTTAVLHEKHELNSLRFIYTQRIWMRYNVDVAQRRRTANTFPTQTPLSRSISVNRPLTLVAEDFKMKFMTRWRHLFIFLQLPRDKPVEKLVWEQMLY